MTQYANVLIVDGQFVAFVDAETLVLTPKREDAAWYTRDGILQARDLVEYHSVLSRIDTACGCTGGDEDGFDA